jgi:hypothetical protein
VFARSRSSGQSVCNVSGQQLVMHGYSISSQPTRYVREVRLRFATGAVHDPDGTWRAMRRGVRVRYVLGDPLDVWDDRHEHDVRASRAG